MADAVVEKAGPRLSCGTVIDLENDALLLIERFGRSIGLPSGRKSCPPTTLTEKVDSAAPVLATEMDALRMLSWSGPMRVAVAATLNVPSELMMKALRLSVAKAPITSLGVVPLARLLMAREKTPF